MAELRKSWSEHLFPESKEVSPKEANRSQYHDKGRKFGVRTGNSLCLYPTSSEHSLAWQPSSTMINESVIEVDSFDRQREITSDFDKNLLQEKGITVHPPSNTWRGGGVSYSLGRKKRWELLKPTENMVLLNERNSLKTTKKLKKTNPNTFLGYNQMTETLERKAEEQTNNSQDDPEDSQNEKKKKKKKQPVSQESKQQNEVDWVIVKNRKGRKAVPANKKKAKNELKPAPEQKNIMVMQITPAVGTKSISDKSIEKNHHRQEHRAHVKSVKSVRQMQPLRNLFD